MRILILIVFLGTINLLNLNAQNQNNMEHQIKEAIILTHKAAANRNVEQLDKLLHKDYRVVANRFKGNDEVVIILKKQYLQMMKEEKIGGTFYNINFKDINVFKHTAFVDVLYTSKNTSSLHKYLVLIQEKNNIWKIVSDIPVVIE